MPRSPNDVAQAGSSGAAHLAQRPRRRAARRRTRTPPCAGASAPSQRSLHCCFQCPRQHMTQAATWRISPANCAAAAAVAAGLEPSYAV